LLRKSLVLNCPLDRGVYGRTRLKIDVCQLNRKQA
jgi:hypothetical protein